MPKPSFGCMACRQRRVKCDERMGGCQRCERYRVRCPGYQHPLDVLLRQHGHVKAVQYTSIHGRQSIQWTDSKGSYQERQPTNISMNMASTLLESQILFTPLPSTGLDDAALGVYYSAYCVSSSTLCSLDHIRRQGNGCLWAAIKLLGMLQIHQIRQLSGGVDTLLKQYASATNLLNTAIASSAESREDYTLLATLLLSIVEMKASPDFSLHYWLVHTNGAAALLEFRGADQILSRLGAALFFQISSQIVVYSILGKRCIPEALRNLRNMIRPFVISTMHPLWQWHGLMHRFADFWATAHTSKPEMTAQDAQAIITQALSIYDDMRIVFQSAGKYWEFGTRPSTEFYPLISHEHVYPSLLTNRVWNDRRTATILLFTVICRTAAHCDGRIPLEKDPQRYIEDAREVARNAALETLAAVPQVLAGLEGRSSAYASPASTRSPELCDSNSEYDEQVFQCTRQNLPKLPYLDSCRVQWSVYFAVQCELVPPQIRSCLLRVLENAGNIMQIQQWQVLADSVRSKLETPDQGLHDPTGLCT